MFTKTTTYTETYTNEIQIKRCRKKIKCCSKNLVNLIDTMKVLSVIWSQAAELAEFTAKIALLEDAKKKKEDEATEWQHKVRLASPHFSPHEC